MKLAPLATFVLAAPIWCQGVLVVPDAFAVADAPGMLAVPGVAATERQQVLIDANHLKPLVGRTITGIVLRRDAGFADALAPAQGNLTVHLGVSPVTPDAASPVFATNLPAASLAFQGAVAAPGSPATGARMVGWSAPDVIEIAFQHPFAYAGGTLCIAFDGVGTAGDWWPIDSTEDTTSGTVLVHGTACGACAVAHGQTASVSPRDLVIGRTAICKLFGEPGAPAFLLLGMQALAAPMDLTILGASGCSLYLDPMTAIPARVSPALPGAIACGTANVNFHLPSNTALLATPFALQWVELATTGLATSNALLCATAPAPPSLGIAVVWQRPGGATVIDTSRVPVIGLRWQ